MTVVVNGHEHQLPETATVADLVRSVGRDPSQAGTAVARNGAVVPRRSWDQTHLRNSDAVEIVTAVGGG
ncbi:MAG: sulfur carrier protein ThiS [Nitriliruptorales bacterium]|nr:sulfur carrier protein ThiS [Nitriliruptorales bacterium]